MTKLYICFALLLVVLSACGLPQETSPLQGESLVPSIPNKSTEPTCVTIGDAEATSVGANSSTELLKVGEFRDIGAQLYPNICPKDREGAIRSQFQNGMLHVWGSGKTIRYDYIKNELMRTYQEEIVPLGQSHYYSCEQKDDATWSISLYDGELNRIGEYFGLQSAMPSVNGQYLVTVDLTITVVNVASGEEHEYDLTSLFGPNDAGYKRGSIVASYFDGNKVYFTSYDMAHPHSDSAKNLIGYYDVVSGKSKCFEFPISFIGVPYYIAENKVWYWQSRSGGSDPPGSYCVLLDANSDAIFKIDVGNSYAILINDNIVVVDVNDRNGQLMGKINAFTFYSGDDYSQVNSISVNSENAPYFYDPGVGFTQSEDGNYICVAGFYDMTTPLHSLFVYRVG